MIKNYPDHAANERTFLSWVRTAIAVVGFGLAAARLGSGEPVIWTEILLLITSAVVIVIAYIRMRWLRARIVSSEELDDGSLAPDTLLVLLIVALFMMLAIFGLHVS